jgi:hypothetical protein
MTTTKTFFSTNDEVFNKSDIGEVIDELEGEHDSIVGLEYYSHEFKLVDLTKYLDADQVLERADEYLYDNVGNEDGDWDVFEGVSKEAKDELSALLKDWVNKHLSNADIYEPHGKSTTHVITESDLA